MKAAKIEQFDGIVVVTIPKEVIHSLPADTHGDLCLGETLSNEWGDYAVPNGGYCRAEFCKDENTCNTDVADAMQALRSLNIPYSFEKNTSKSIPKDVLTKAEESPKVVDKEQKSFEILTETRHPTFRATLIELERWGIVFAIPPSLDLKSVGIAALNHPMIASVNFSSHEYTEYPILEMVFKQRDGSYVMCQWNASRWSTDQPGCVYTYIWDK